MTSTDIEKASPSTQREIMATFYDPDLDFRKLAAEATFFTRGFRLVHKDALLGVPHVITGVVFREGFPRDGVKGDYVSVEAVVADAEYLDSAVVQQQRKDAGAEDELTVFPNEPVIYNDSGTGIRRGLTEMFTGLGIIDPGPSKGDENRFDRQFQLWKAGADVMTSGINGVIPAGPAAGEKFRMVVSRGLRKSEYINEFGDATTWYLG